MEWRAARLFVALLALGGWLGVGRGVAQGTVDFTTRRIGSVDAKVTVFREVSGGGPAGADHVATLYWGSAANQLQQAQVVTNGVASPLRVPFVGTTGYVVAGKIAIVGAPEGSAVYVQMRAWSKAYGTWEEANSVNGGSGHSNLILVRLGGDNLIPTQPPALLVGLQGFQIIDATWFCPSPDSSYEAWTRNFWDCQTALPVVKDRTADPDRDGFANLVEYALGMDPTTPGGTGLPVLMLVTGADGERIAEVQFRAYKWATEITYRCWRSRTLDPPVWEPVSGPEAGSEAVPAQYLSQRFVLGPVRGFESLFVRFEVVR
jgi:hypothetical protein